VGRGTQAEEDVEDFGDRATRADSEEDDTRQSREQSEPAKSKNCHPEEEETETDGEEKLPREAAGASEGKPEDGAARGTHPEDRGNHDADIDQRIPRHRTGSAFLHRRYPHKITRPTRREER
jgi:hypothetical protein